VVLISIHHATLFVDTGTSRGILTTRNVFLDEFSFISNYTNENSLLLEFSALHKVLQLLLQLLVHLALAKEYLVHSHASLARAASLLCRCFRHTIMCDIVLLA